MQSQNNCENTEVSHPSKWKLLLDQFLASPMRLHRYRNLTTHMLEDSIDKIDCGSCK
jgi:hypothetical protein